MTDLAPPILASGSPRRRQWFEAMGLPFEIHVPHVDETPLPDEEPGDMVLRLARLKAATVARAHPGRWVVASDTTVAVDHHVLNKPVDVEDAVRMLGLIQGRAHEVHTGFCLTDGREEHAFVDTARVVFRPMDEAVIRWYVASGEPMDKAGAYAAQGLAALFLERIEGSFATVMGLPVERMGLLLQERGLLAAWMGLPG